MIKPVVLNCTPVLPTAYGDALSYYEEICKLVEKTNEIIKDINDNLTGYIDNYFNGIMVNAVYDEENETIILSKELVTTGDTHTYNASTNTLIVR